MFLKFTKIIIISGFFSLGFAHALDPMDIDQSKKYLNSSVVYIDDEELQNEDYHHRKLRYLVDSFYEHYDICKEELNKQNIHFFGRNYLDIVEDNFEYFTESKMTKWVMDYFDDRIKSPLAAIKEFNIYDPIYSVVAIFFEAVSLSDECEYSSSDNEETLSEEENNTDWVAFIQGLQPIANDLFEKYQSKTEVSYDIN